MTAWLWALLAATCAVGNEWAFRTYRGASFYELWWAWPIQLGVSYGIWRLLRGNDIISGVILFNICTAFLRTGAAFLLRESISPGAWAAFGLVILAGLIKTAWR